MTEYVRVEIQHVSRGVWRGYIPAYDLFVSATSQPKLEYEAFRALEAEFGLKAFIPVWIEC